MTLEEMKSYLRVDGTDSDADDMVTKAIMIVDGKVVDKNSLVTLAIAMA